MMRSLDQRFIDMMVPHHLSPVEMAKIAADALERPSTARLSVSTKTPGSAARREG